MSRYDDMKVSLSIGDLSAIHSAANCFEFADKKHEESKRRYAELLKGCETQAAEINKLRCELSTRPQQPREVSPVLRQKIENAKDVLRQITPAIADCDGNYYEVEGHRFNSVYNTLQDLYDVLRVEVQQ